MKRVLIVEDQRFARDHLENCVIKNKDYYLVKSVTSAIYAEDICKSSAIDLVIMDVCTEFDADGIEVSTVHYHVNNMLHKTGYPNRNRLVIAVFNKKLIVPGSDRDLFG